MWRAQLRKYKNLMPLRVDCSMREIQLSKKQLIHFIFQVLLLRQVTTFYKEKDQQEELEIRNKLFIKDQLLQKKDNIIKSLQLNVLELGQSLSAKGYYVVEKFILDPSEWNLNFSKQLQNKDAQIIQLAKENKSLKLTVEQLKSQLQSQVDQINKNGQLKSSSVNIQQNNEGGHKKQDNSVKEQVKGQTAYLTKLQSKVQTIVLEQEPEEVKHHEPLRETFGKSTNPSNLIQDSSQNTKKNSKFIPPSNPKSSSEKDLNFKTQNSFTQPKAQGATNLGHSQSEQQYQTQVPKESQKESYSFKGLSSVEESVSQQNVFTPNTLGRQMLNQPSPTNVTPLNVETISDQSKGFPYMHKVVQGNQQQVKKQDINEAQIIDTVESRDQPFSPKVETVHSHYKYKDVVPPLDLQNISGSKSNASINKDLKGVKSQNSLFNQEQEKKQKPVFQEQKPEFKSPFKSIPFNKSPQGHSKTSNKDVQKQGNKAQSQNPSQEKNKSAVAKPPSQQNMLMLNHLTDSEDQSSKEGQSRTKVDDFLKQFEVFNKESAESDHKNTLNSKPTGKTINIEDQGKREEGKQFLNTEGDKKYQIINGIKVLVLDEGDLSDSPETQKNQSKVLQPSKNQSVSENMYQEVEIVEEEEEEINNTLQTETMNGQRNKVIPVQKRVSTQNITQNSWYENEESEHQIQTTTYDQRGIQRVSPPPSTVKQFGNQGTKDVSPFSDIPRFNEQKVPQASQQQQQQQQTTTQILTQSKVINYDNQNPKPKPSSHKQSNQSQAPQKSQSTESKQTKPQSSQPTMKPQPEKQIPTKPLSKVQVERQVYITEKQRTKQVNGQEVKEHLIVEEEEEEDTQPNEIVRRPQPHSQGFFSGIPFDNKVKKEKEGPLHIEEEQIIEESEEEEMGEKDNEMIRENLRRTQKNLFDNFDRKVEKDRGEKEEEHEIIVEEEEEEELEEEEKKLIQSQLRRTQQQNQLITEKVGTQKQKDQEEEEEIIIEEEEEEESQNEPPPPQANGQRQTSPFLKSQGALVVQEKSNPQKEEDEEIIIVEEEEEEDDPHP